MSSGKTYEIKCDDPPEAGGWVSVVVPVIGGGEWVRYPGPVMWTDGAVHKTWQNLLKEYGPVRELPPGAMPGTTVILLASGESSGRPFMDEVLVSGSIYGLWYGDVRGRYVDLRGDDEITKWKVLGVVGKDGVLRA